MSRQVLQGIIIIPGDAIPNLIVLPPIFHDMENAFGIRCLDQEVGQSVTSRDNFPRW